MRSHAAVSRPRIPDPVIASPPPVISSVGFPEVVAGRPVPPATVTPVSVVIVVVGWQTVITAHCPQGGPGGGTVHDQVGGWEERGEGEATDNGGPGLLSAQGEAD